MRLCQVTGVLVDQEVEEWYTHRSLGEGPAIAQAVYKRVSQMKKQDARK